MILDINGRKFTGHSASAIAIGVAEAVARWLASGFAVLHPYERYWEAIHPDGRSQYLEIIDLALSPIERGSTREETVG